MWQMQHLVNLHKYYFIDIFIIIMIIDG